jgi:hypothetical protein
VQLLILFFQNPNSDSTFHRFVTFIESSPSQQEFLGSFIDVRVLCRPFPWKRSSISNRPNDDSDRDSCSGATP